MIKHLLLALFAAPSLSFASPALPAIDELLVEKAIVLPKKVSPQFKLAIESAKPTIRGLLSEWACIVRVDTPEARSVFTKWSTSDSFINRAAPGVLTMQRHQHGCLTPVSVSDFRQRGRDIVFTAKWQAEDSGEYARDTFLLIEADTGWAAHF